MQSLIPFFRCRLFFWLTIMPHVSVVVPTYNALPYLASAVQSILAQSFADLELLILDDASTDDTQHYLRSIVDSRVRVHHCKKQGQGALRNLGVSLASSQFIAFMDADDLALPNRLALQLQYLEANPDVVACGCQMMRLDENGKIGELIPFDEHDAMIRFRMLTNNHLPNPGALFRKEAFERIGGCRPCLVPAEDYDLWLRMGKVGALANVPHVLLYYRVHSANISVTQRSLQERTAERLAIAEVVATHYARSRHDARRFRRFDTTPGTRSYTISNAESFVRVTRRYLAAHLHLNGIQPLVRLCQELRWQFQREASKYSYLSPDRYRWWRLSLKINPNKIDILDSAKRRFASVYSNRKNTTNL